MEQIINWTGTKSKLKKGALVYAFGKSNVIYAHSYGACVFVGFFKHWVSFSGEKKLLGWEPTRPRLSAWSSAKKGWRGNESWPPGEDFKHLRVWSRRLRRIGTVFAEILIVVSCSLHSRPHLWTWAVGHGAQSRAERVQQRWFRHPGRLQVVFSFSNWEETRGQI